MFDDAKSKTSIGVEKKVIEEDPKTNVRLTSDMKDIKTAVLDALKESELITSSPVPIVPLAVPFPVLPTPPAEPKITQVIKEKEDAVEMVELFLGEVVAIDTSSRITFVEMQEAFTIWKDSNQVKFHHSLTLRKIFPFIKNPAFQSKESKKKITCGMIWNGVRLKEKKYWKSVT